MQVKRSTIGHPLTRRMTTMTMTMTMMMTMMTMMMMTCDEDYCRDNDDHNYLHHYRNDFVEEEEE